MKRILLSILLLVLVVSFASARVAIYDVDTYSDNSYLIQQNLFIQGDSVYAKGTSSIPYPYLKVSYFNPSGNLVYFCESNLIGKPSNEGFDSRICNYNLSSTSPVGTWTVKLEKSDLSIPPVWSIIATNTFDVYEPPIVSEFSTIIGALTIISAIGVFFFVRRE